MYIMLGKYYSKSFDITNNSSDPAVTNKSTQFSTENLNGEHINLR